MRTAIFVYQTMSINISTNESNLQLCRLNADTVSLVQGQNTRTIAPGIYKIVSDQCIDVTGDTAAFDIVVAPNDKDNVPKLPPRLTATSFGPLDVFALQAFFAVPDAKLAVNP